MFSFHIPTDLLPLPLLFVWTKDAAIISLGLYLLDSQKPPFWVRLLLLAGLLLLGLEMIILDAQAPLTALVANPQHSALLSLSALFCFLCVALISTLNMLLRRLVYGFTYPLTTVAVLRETRPQPAKTKLT